MSSETESKRAGHGPSTDPGESHEHEELEEYAGGYIQAHHGTIAPWLLIVYAVLLVWGLYYMVAYWGGLGPGLDY
ncbi:MAG: hypothetical protein ACREDZ_15955 [Kiloniellales bacterium]